MTSVPCRWLRQPENGLFYYVLRTGEVMGMERKGHNKRKFGKIAWAPGYVYWVKNGHVWRKSLKRRGRSAASTSSVRALTWW